MTAEATADTATDTATATGAATATAPETRGAWQATHVFYAANPRPLLLRAVRPLVRALGEEGLPANWFFINYWLEGPHVRLRPRPSLPEAEPEVRQRIEEAIDAFPPCAAGVRHGGGDVTAAAERTGERTAAPSSAMGAAQRFRAAPRLAESVRDFLTGRQRNAPNRPGGGPGPALLHWCPTLSPPGGGGFLGGFR